MTMDVTDDEIRALRMDALHAGAWDVFDLCLLALAPAHEAEALAPLLELVAEDGQPMTRSEARTQCAEAIAMVRAARAQD